MPEKPDSLVKRIILYLLLQILLVSGIDTSVYAQETPSPYDTSSVIDNQIPEEPDTLDRNPRKAALYSAILPGLGQYYNKKYWKIPIVYAGFGTFVYFIDRNSRYYKDLKQKLIDPDYELKYFDGDFTPDQLNRGKDLYKRWRDLSIIGTAGFYIFQIIDATVDAYLFDWDVGEDISLRLEPSASPSLNPLIPANSFGLSACISF